MSNRLIRRGSRWRLSQFYKEHAICACYHVSLRLSADVPWTIRTRNGTACSDSETAKHDCRTQLQNLLAVSSIPDKLSAIRDLILWALSHPSSATAVQFCILRELISGRQDAMTLTVGSAEMRWQPSSLTVVKGWRDGGRVLWIATNSLWSSSFVMSGKAERSTVDCPLIARRNRLMILTSGSCTLTAANHHRVLGKFQTWNSITCSTFPFLKYWTEIHSRKTLSATFRSHANK